MIHAVLSVTGLLFWCIIGVVILLDVLALSTEDDSFGAWGVVATVGAILGTICFTDATATLNIIWFAVGMMAYLLLGVAWSFKKWVDYVREQKEGKYSKPQASKNKQRIITWMATWPLSFSWWLLTYPRHFFIWAYNRLTTVFDRITDKIWNEK